MTNKTETADCKFIIHELAAANFFSRVYLVRKEEEQKERIKEGLKNLDFYGGISGALKYVTDYFEERRNWMKKGKKYGKNYEKELKEFSLPEDFEKKTKEFYESIQKGEFENINAEQANNLMDEGLKVLDITKKLNSITKGWFEPDR